jgi:hypothetical protein
MKSQFYILSDSTKQKLLYFFSGALFILFPFLNVFFKVFRGVSISFVHHFERHASFDFKIPSLFQKYIHFYLTEIWIIGLVIGALILKEIRVKNLFLNRHSRYLTLYIGAALLSILFSLFSSYFTQYIFALRLMIAFMGFHLFYLLFQKQTNLIQPILWAFLIVALLESFIGIGQFLFQHSLGLTFLNEPQVTPYMKDAPVYPMNEINRTFFDLLPWIPEGHSQVLRSLGTFDHPNVFGTYLLIALFIGYFLFITTERKGCKALLLFAIPLFILTLGLTFSRGSIFAWILGTFLSLAVGWIKRSSFSLQERKQLTLLSLLLGLGCLGVFALLFKQLIARGGFFNYNAIAANSDQGRLLLFHLAVLLFKTHPLLGIGYNGYSLFPYGTLHPEYEGANEIGTHSHNIYLQIAAETGIIGLVLIGLFLFSLLRLLRKSEMTPLRLTLGSIFISFLFLGLIDHFLWTYNSGRMMFFLFTALFAAAFSPPTRYLPNAVNIQTTPKLE